MLTMTLKTITSEKSHVDHATGEVLYSELESKTFKTSKQERYAMIFVERMGKFMGATGDESSLFAEMIRRMNDKNHAYFTPTEKQDFVIDEIYSRKDKKSGSDEKKVRTQAGRRFSQIVKGLIKKDLVTQIDAYRYQVNPELVAYGFDGWEGVNQRRSDYLKFKSVYDIKTGKMKSVLNDGVYKTNEGDHAFVDSDGYEVGL